MGHCLFFDTLDELQSYLGVGEVVLSELTPFTKHELDGSAKPRLIWTFFGPRSTPRCPLLSGLCCPAWKKRWRTASTSSGFTALWSGSSWRCPTHPTTYRSVRPSDSPCAERSVLGSSSSESSACVASPHPPCGAGLQRPLVAWCHHSSAATSFVARSTWVTSSWRKPW